MKEIVNSIQRLKQCYEMLVENTDSIFNALKTRDYEKKKLLELDTEKIYKQKEAMESFLIQLIIDKATNLGLEDKRIEAILNVKMDLQDKMSIQYELDNMLKIINKFQLNLKRNIEFAKAFIKVESEVHEIMFEAAERENYGPMLLNEEI